MTTKYYFIAYEWQQKTLTQKVNAVISTSPMDWLLGVLTIGEKSNEEYTLLFYSEISKSEFDALDGVIG